MKRASIQSLILIFALSMSAIAQSSASSTPTNASPSATPDGQQQEVLRQAADIKAETKGARLDLAERQIARLVSEVKAGRQLLAAQRDNLKAAEAALALEQKNSASLTASYESAQREITALRASIISLQAAIDAKEQAIKLLIEQRDKARKSAKKWKKRAGAAGLMVVGLLYLTFRKR